MKGLQWVLTTEALFLASDRLREERKREVGQGQRTAGEKTPLETWVNRLLEHRLNA